MGIKERLRGDTLKWYQKARKPGGRQGRAGETQWAGGGGVKGQVAGWASQGGPSKAGAY